MLRWVFLQAETQLEEARKASNNVAKDMRDEEGVDDDDGIDAELLIVQLQDAEVRTAECSVATRSRNSIWFCPKHCTGT